MNDGDAILAGCFAVANRRPLDRLPYAVLADYVRERIDAGPVILSVPFRGGLATITVRPFAGTVYLVSGRSNCGESVPDSRLAHWLAVHVQRYLSGGG